MGSILIANHSSYPRIGEGSKEQNLRRAIGQLERGETSEQELDEITDEVIRSVILEQEEAGVDLVTDGQIRWHDPVSHWLKNFKGVRLRGLLRYFDTNFYFRVPRIEGSLERRGSIVRQDCQLAVRLAQKPVKVVLTGPLTLAVLSERVSSIESVVESLTSFMKEDIGSIAAAGALWIQIDEPMILRRPEFFPILARYLKSFGEQKGSARISLATYFGDATPFYGKLQDLSVDGLVLDCVYGKGLLDQLISVGSEKVLGLGIVDGRSTLLETADPKSKLMKQLDRIRRSLGEGELNLTSSCGLEYLPRVKAFEKLRLLKKFGEMLS